MREDRSPGGKHRHKRQRTDDIIAMATGEILGNIGQGQEFSDPLVERLVAAQPDRIPHTDGGWNWFLQFLILVFKMIIIIVVIMIIIIIIVVMICLLVGCLTSQRQASVSQGRICTDNLTCCHTEIEVADQTFHLTQPHYTDTRPTSPSADPIPPGAWQGSRWSANV